MDLAAIRPERPMLPLERSNGRRGSSSKLLFRRRLELESGLLVLGFLAALLLVFLLLRTDRVLHHAVVTEPLRPQEQTVKPSIKAYIGCFTAFGSEGGERDYGARRAALRSTWFPGSQAELQRWEAEYRLVVRFVVGHSGDAAQEAALAQEALQHGDMLRLPLMESYAGLPNKTRTFFRAVWERYDARWVIKTDDDVFLIPQRLLRAMRQWEALGGGAGGDYIGCMKHGSPWTKPGSRWFEPNHILAGHTYWLHAYGSIYALSGRAVRNVFGGSMEAFLSLRLLANEDTSVGAWLLAHDALHFEDRRLCTPACNAASVAVLRNRCAGLCNPLQDLQELQQDPLCGRSQADAAAAAVPDSDSLPYVPSHPEHKAFERMWVP